MRTKPTAETMTPEQILRKRPFLVPIPANHPGYRAAYGIPKAEIAEIGGLQYEKRTQASFLREYNVNAHSINSIKYYPNIFRKDTKGKIKMKVHTRVAVAFQEMIKTKRKTALLGNNIGMKLISNRDKYKKQDILAEFREGWEAYNFEIAFDKALDSDYITADCAIYVYMSENKKVGWRVFSFLDGDTLYPHFNPVTGEITLLGRRYTEEDDDGTIRSYLDVIDEKSFLTYQLSNTTDNNGEEKWVLLGEPQPHGFDICPVAYHRRSTGPVWSASQSLTENYELGISQFCENNMSYGLRILYTAGADFNLETNTDGTPSRIDSPDANAKAGFLEPAEGADGAFAKQLEILYKNIMRCSFTVETPEIKSGADMSSLTVKMLFADSYLKALEDSQEYQLFLDRLVYLFKFAYFTVTNRANEVDSFMIKPYLEPFVFMSETEVINALVQLTSIGVLSKQTATEIAYNSGYGTAAEWDRILKETQAELVASEMTNQQQTKNNPINTSRNQ